MSDVLSRYAEIRDRDDGDTGLKTVFKVVTSAKRRLNNLMNRKRYIHYAIERRPSMEKRNSIDLVGEMDATDPMVLHLDPLKHPIRIDEYERAVLYELMELVESRVRLETSVIMQAFECLRKLGIGVIEYEQIARQQRERVST